MFVTNNSSLVVADQEAALAAIGIPAAGDVLTSAMAAAALSSRASGCSCAADRASSRRSPPAARVAVAGDDPSATTVDAVVVGFHRDFDYERLRIAGDGGARRGPADRHQRRRDVSRRRTDRSPAAGRSWPRSRRRPGVEPVIAGKPYQPMADLVRRTVVGRVRSGDDG